MNGTIKSEYDKDRKRVYVTIWDTEYGLTIEQAHVLANEITRAIDQYYWEDYPSLEASEDSDDDD